MLEPNIRASKNNRSQLIKILNKPNNTETEIKRAVKIMEECGALKHCHKQAMGYLEGANKTLKKYPESEARDMLEELLEYMVTRGH